MHKKDDPHSAFEEVPLDTPVNPFRFRTVIAVLPVSETTKKMDRYWPKKYFLLFAKCLKVYALAFKV
jgi:hypothetical protein